MNLATHQEAIKNWLKNFPLVFRTRWDADSLTLIETGTAKQVTIDTKRITNHRLTPHAQSGGSYLNLVFENGIEVVLCHAGLAFAPSFVATGPLPDAPPVSCFADYFTLLNNLRQIMTDASRRAEALLIVQVLISILDGAKAVGFETGTEEEMLNSDLERLESQIS